jgi:hypothetical protein
MAYLLCRAGLLLSATAGYGLAKGNSIGSGHGGSRGQQYCLQGNNVWHCAVPELMCGGRHAGLMEVCDVLVDVP